MGDFKYIPGLMVNIPDRDDLIIVQNPVEVLALNPELDVLCVPIKDIVVSKQKAVKPPEDQQATEGSLKTDRNIGTKANPVKLGSRLEGFKLDGEWVYRNSNPEKTNFCTNWLTVKDNRGIKEIDLIYLETRRGKEQH